MISTAFEAFASGSWQPGKIIKIEQGRVTLHSMVDNEIAVDNGILDLRTTSGKPSFLDVRIRSRKATLSDCTSFLRCGIDVCVLSTLQSNDDSDRLIANKVS